MLATISRASIVTLLVAGPVFANEVNTVVDDVTVKIDYDATIVHTDLKSCTDSTEAHDTERLHVRAKLKGRLKVRQRPNNTFVTFEAAKTPGTDELSMANDYRDGLGSFEASFHGNDLAAQLQFETARDDLMWIYGVIPGNGTGHYHQTDVCAGNKSYDEDRPTYGFNLTTDEMSTHGNEVKANPPAREDTPVFHISEKELLADVESKKPFRLVGKGHYDYQGTGAGALHVMSDLVITISTGKVQDSAYEARLEPVDPTAYEKWVPEGPPPAHPDGKGSSVDVKVTLLDKKTGKVVNDVAYSTTFLLSSSREPGIALNFPQPNAAEHKPDLRFDGGNPAHEEVELTTQGKDVQKATIRSYDYGSYGKVSATVTVGSDPPFEAMWTDKGEKRATIDVPRDDNHNHAADQWEKDRGIFAKGYAIKWDEDDFPKGQRRNGDGYTFYEEYRGFVVLGAMLTHLRTDPEKKDIFVYDPDYLFHTYYLPENPSKLVYHFVDKTLMVWKANTADHEHRWINYNSSPDSTYARQYGAVVVSKKINWAGNVQTATLDQQEADRQKYQRPSDLDENVPWGLSVVPGTPNPFGQALKSFYEAEINPEELGGFVARNASTADQKTAMDAQMKTTVIHEVGHLLGIQHHRPNDQNGVLDCAMRYIGAKPDEDRVFITTPQVRYCEAGEKYKMAGVEIPGDDCWEQIDVKMDP